MIKAIALAAFTHCTLNLRRGEEAEFSPPTFTALAAHGLVREASPPQAEQQAPAQRTLRAARALSNKKAPEPDNKAAAEATAPTTAPAPDATAPTTAPAPDATAPTTAPAPDAATDPATPPAVEAEPAPAADPAAPAGEPDAAAHA